MFTRCRGMGEAGETSGRAVPTSPWWWFGRRRGWTFAQVSSQLGNLRHIHRKRLTIDSLPGAIATQARMRVEGERRPRWLSCSQNGAVFSAQFGRTFPFFPGGAFGFADGNHESGLRRGEFPAAGRSATAADIGEIGPDFGGKNDPFGRHGALS